MGKSCRNIILRICIVVLAIDPCSHLLALNPDKTINQYCHDKWTQQNGLPSSAIYACLQTPDGYLWLGTSSGLYHFDGANFTRINTNSQDERIKETISVLLVSKDSGLWVGTSQCGLKCIKNGKLTGFGPDDGLTELQIHTLFQSKNGYIWVGTSYGLFKYSKNKFKSVTIDPAYITSITGDSFGRIWIGTQSGILIYDEESEKQIDKIDERNGLRSHEIITLKSDPQLGILIGTSKGFFSWENGKLESYSGKNSPSNIRIHEICKDKNGNLWIGTPNGIYRYAKSEWSTMNEMDGLTNNFILSMSEDYEGSLWIGTWNGLNRFRDVNITSYTTREGLATNYIWNIIETKDNNLYLLSHVDPIITRYKDGKFFKSDSIMGGPAFAARDSSLWICQNGTLLRIKNGYTQRFDTSSGLPLKWISAITEDDKSLIIFIESIGLRRFKNGRVRPYLMKDGKQYLSTEYTMCLYYQTNGDLWIGTTNGLTRIQDGQSTTYGIKDGMAGKWNYSINDDGNGSLWISSSFEGLTRYRNGTFTAYAVKDGLFTNELYCTLCDDDGNLWLSSPTGIGCIKKKNIEDYDAGRTNSLNPRVYSAADGMKIGECLSYWPPAAWKAHDGRLWFVIKKGVVMIDPKTFRNNEIPPAVCIEKIVADQQTMPLNKLIDFDPDVSKIEFHYTALSFLIPERVLFKYKLDGYDREWVDVQTRRVAYYTNLPPGDYRFRVMACNNDGVWNEAGASYEFTLKPHFYQTYLFYGLTILFLIGIIYSVIQLRLWQHVKKEEALQKRIHEAMANIKMLGGLIPICAHCKKIRDDRGYWDKLEEYIQDHSEAKFSHSICPECMEKFYPKVSQTKKSSEI